MSNKDKNKTNSKVLLVIENVIKKKSWPLASDNIDFSLEALPNMSPVSDYDKTIAVINVGHAQKLNMN